MYTLNGKIYAKNNDEFVSSLFKAGNTCNGFYKKIKNGVKLFDIQNNLKAFVVANAHGERFIVSAGTTSSGKPFYMSSTDTQTEEWLGITGLTMWQEHDIVEQSLSSSSI